MNTRTFQFIGISVRCVLIVLTALSGTDARAQTTSPTYYYCIERLSDGLVVRRGTARSQGIPQNGLILGPNTPYRFWMLEAHTGLTGFTEFVTPDNGFQFTIPNISLSRSLAPDFDGDGLRDDAEFVAGTDPTKQDTDLDGLKDFVEMKQGLDPLDGLNVRTGVLGGTATPGSAVDICAFNDIAVVAEGDSISVFNIFNRMPPLLIGRVQVTNSVVNRVACEGNLVAAACGLAGLAVVDISKPPDLRLLPRVIIGGNAQAVAVAGGIAYVGTAEGVLVSVEMTSGTVIERVVLGSPVQDIMLGRDTLYVATLAKLYAFPADYLGVVASAPQTNYPGATLGSAFRLFVADGRGYVAGGRGAFVFNLTNGPVPILIRTNQTTLFGWRQLAPNGSGLALAVTGPTLGTTDLSLYDLNPGGTNLAQIIVHLTPGLASAVSLYNGLAYVADGLSGIQVINYLAYDNGSNRPTVMLSASFPLNPAQAEEGKLARLSAAVTDDVQVRNVEFYVDGERIATDGNFPFEVRFTTPMRSGGRGTFRVKARASDTGGNATWTDEFTVTLVPDATPPRILRTFPTSSTILGSVDLVLAYFNEPIDPATLNGATFEVKEAGPDQALRSPDDVVVSTGTLSYREEVKAAVITFPTNLPPGLYLARLNPPLSDLAGNPLASPYEWQFWVTGGQDSDQDGIPDLIEVALGYDPTKPDTNNNGVLDGDEDKDADGLPNRWEIAFNLDPQVRDTNGNGINDGNEDFDNDGLSNAQELARGTDPRRADTDGDGWPDETEVTAGSNPTDASSRPFRMVVAAPPVGIVLPGSVDSGLPLNTVVATPPVSVVLPSLTDPNVPPNVTVARPPVSLVLPSLLDANLPANTTVARPPVSIVLPSSGDPNVAANVTVAGPPVSLLLPSTSDPNAPANTTVARPPVSIVLPSSADPYVPPNTTVARPPVDVRLNTP